MAGAARTLSTAPSLDDLAANPDAAEVLSTAEVATLIVRALTVVGALGARVVRDAVMDGSALRGNERMIGTEAVADRLDRSISWVEKHLDDLPPRRALAGSPAWREADINDWIRTTPRY